MASSSYIPRFKLMFHVPPSALQSTKDAVFAAGAGRHPGPGNYTECCFVTIGTGQFLPGSDANPYIGGIGEVETVQEAKVEVLCVGEAVTRRAVAALKSAHPYETPSYAVYRLEDF